jgi:hypothetical protein
MEAISVFLPFFAVEPLPLGAALFIKLVANSPPVSMSIYEQKQFMRSFGRNTMEFTLFTQMSVEMLQPTNKQL